MNIGQRGWVLILEREAFTTPADYPMRTLFINLHGAYGMCKTNWLLDSFLFHTFQK